jgi:hypothetical protein
MKKNDILKSFIKENGSLMFIIKRNNFKYYLSIVLVLLSILLSLRGLSRIEKVEGEKDLASYIWFFLVFILPFILYLQFYKSQKEQFLILKYIESADEFCFYLKKANRKDVKILLINDLQILSVSSKGDDEIILLSNEKLDWGNRKLVLSDEFKDRKEEVVEFLKLIFLNK